MSKMSLGGSNLVKSYRLSVNNEDIRIIDSNSHMEEKLDRLRLVMPMEDFGSYDEEAEAEGTGGFVDGIDASMLDALTSDEYDAYSDEDGGNVSNVIKANPVSEPAYEGPSYDEMMESAKAEIEQMQMAAMEEIERMKASAYDEGKRQGYEDGMNSANASLASAWEELESARGALDAEREQMVLALEPQFVDYLTRIYEKIFDVELSEHKDLIVNLIHNTMMRIESSSNYLIHVSKDDYDFVAENKQSLYTTSMPEDVSVDIIEDVTMRSGDCMIETSGGIYDCGLGTQLDTLKKKLELLSFAP